MFCQKALHIGASYCYAVGPDRDKSFNETPVFASLTGNADAITTHLFHLHALLITL